MKLTLSDLDHFEATAMAFCEGAEGLDGNPYALRDVILSLIDEHRACLLGRGQEVHSSALVHLHRRVYYWRNWRKLTAQEAAEEIGVSATTISRFESGESDPTLSSVRKFLMWTEAQAVR